MPQLYTYARLSTAAKWRTDKCSFISIFTRILKLLDQIALMFSVKYYYSQHPSPGLFSVRRLISNQQKNNSPKDHVAATWKIQLSNGITYPYSFWCQSCGLPILQRTDPNSSWDWPVDGCPTYWISPEVSDRQKLSWNVMANLFRPCRPVLRTWCLALELLNVALLRFGERYWARS